MKSMSREEFVEAVGSGRKFVRAGLYERQDYMLDLGTYGGRCPIRDITNEPDQHGRPIMGQLITKG